MPRKTNERSEASRSVFINHNLDDFVGTKSRKRNAPFLPSTLLGLVIGPSNCGKSNVVLNLILGGYLDFTKLYVYSTTLGQDKMALLQASVQAAERKTKTDIGLFVDNEQDLPDPSQLDKKEQNLLLLDDVIAQKQSGKILSYFTRGRHANCNVLYLSQSLYKIPKNALRDNANFILLFYGLSATDVRQIGLTYASDLTLKQFRSFYNRGAGRPHEFCVIDMTKGPDERYRFGFNELVDRDEL